MSVFSQQDSNRANQHSWNLHSIVLGVNSYGLRIDFWWDSILDFHRGSNRTCFESLTFVHITFVPYCYHFYQFLPEYWICSQIKLEPLLILLDQSRICFTELMLDMVICGMLKRKFPSPIFCVGLLLAWLDFSSRMHKFYNISEHDQVRLEFFNIGSN